MRSYWGCLGYGGYAVIGVRGYAQFIHSVQVIVMPGYWGAQLLGCPDIGNHSYWAAGLLGCPIIGVRGYWDGFIRVLELFRCPVTEVPDYWDAGFFWVLGYWGDQLLRY